MIFTTAVYFYIFVKKSIEQYNFWQLVVTTFAFWLLFVGAGRQKCYQEKLKYPEKYGCKFTFDDPAEKQDTWTWGVIFFAQALPMSLVSLIMHMTTINTLFEDR